MHTTTTSHDQALSPAAPSGEKSKAKALLRAIQTLKALEQPPRAATPEERHLLACFPGFGPVALRLFPDPVSGRCKDPSWQRLADELRALLTPDEYASAKRTTFTAFYTAPVVIQAMHDALAHLGVPPDATVLEPGCGIGHFMRYAPPGMRFLGVEQDSLSGRIAQALYPHQDIRIENFRDTHLPAEQLDAVIGNVPFADVRLPYRGTRLALHDFFLAKSLEALKPGGILALVTSHYTLDKANPTVRTLLAEHADFLGAIRLPSDAFTQEGTRVVTDILCLRKRLASTPARHVETTWLDTAPLTIEGVTLPVNRYFLQHPEMVLGTWSRQDRLYGGQSSYSVRLQGDLGALLSAAVQRLPAGAYAARDTDPRPGISQACALPPPQAHLAEGSLYVGADQTLRQVRDGQAVPVRYGQTTLMANGTMMGQRLAALVTLRDEARRVLQSQNEDWPAAQREAARQALNGVYDRFVTAYGPINTTTFSTTAAGAVVRRMPNLVTFRDDPDAMLVMALEDYDELTNRAVKAAIMHRDVVGRSPPATMVHSAEEALLVSLNQRGRVDLPYMATLYRQDVEQIVAELGDLLYQDPTTGVWETADIYLSGHVRTKLAAAESAGLAYARHVEALRAVQPEDVLPGDIDANLGAPWIPDSDIRHFAATLFGVPVTALHIGHLKQDALWTVDGEVSVRACVAASTDYGTDRANGVWLLEQALNLKTPAIYDLIETDGREERVLNQEATVAAREKLARIKAQFKAWVFADPDRTERLVRLYNDTYNNLRLRHFDGAHLDFPGMTPQVTLHAHQKDAIWRVMSSGNTLLAHAVGAGKTYVMAAAGMKLKQAGLITKPLYVVPNHMLEQFAREFMQLYPNARLLIAGKEDFTRDKRKLLTAQMASGQWDGIITTHSSFERIGMSRAFQVQFLRTQIAVYEQLLCDSVAADASRAQRNIIKAIEKQKARREERLKDLLAEDKKDDGLVFDELGIDHLFIDEAHVFKNLETPTKMDRVAGIQTTGSERAFDLYMKTQYLHQRHPGHGVTFATGTPISNTMVELYTMQRYLDPEGLVAREIAHFDAWAATFGEVVDTMEISPDGKTLRPRSRFARFTNLPELQQMFRAFADVQTAAMLNLPRPRLQGDKPLVIACPMSDSQRDLQAQLIARYEAVRAGTVKPWEDNALAITTDGRKLALEARLLSPQAGDFPQAKINALVEEVVTLWQRTTPTRGTQLIFSDLGVQPTPWGYAVYQDLVEKLVQHGIPRDQVADIGSADTDAKKQVLFENVRHGRVRVLLGSTQKMGTGTNVQQRLVALHHLDAPWKPAEVEQRDGRILRQGNTNEDVAIYRYVTAGSFDAYMWQALETKARFIAQVMTGDSTVRQAEDIGGAELSYAEVKAIASGNPAVLTLAEADAELHRLAVLMKHHADEQYLARRKLRDLPGEMTRLERRLEHLARDIATSTAQAHAPLTIGARLSTREEAPEALAGLLRTLPGTTTQTQTFPLGVYRGLRFGLTLSPDSVPEVQVEGALTRRIPLSRDFHGPRAILHAVERLIGSYEAERVKTTRDLDIAQGQRRDYEARLGAGFPHAGYHDALTALRHQLENALAGTTAPDDEAPQPSVEELVDRLKTLRATCTIEAVPVRSGTRPAASLAMAVTTRIRQRAFKPASMAEPVPEPMSEMVPLVPETSTTSTEPPPAPVVTPRDQLFALQEQKKPAPSPVQRPQPVRRQTPAPRQLTLF